MTRTREQYGTRIASINGKCASRVPVLHDKTAGPREAVLISRIHGGIKAREINRGSGCVLGMVLRQGIPKSSGRFLQFEIAGFHMEVQ